jgi:anti-sigma B factor antagonist
MSTNTTSTTRAFRVQRHDGDGCTTVECCGRLTSDNVPMLKESMREVCEKKGRVVLDLKEVPMMDSSGLGAIVGLYVSARTRGCKLEMVNVSQQVIDLFSITNVLSLFEGVGRCGRI